MLCSPSFPSTTFIIFTMLFLLFLYFLSQSSLGGDANSILLMERRADDSCNDLKQCRTMWNILWSCVSTVLLCTWVTLHPNIAITPDTRDTSWFKAKLWHPLCNFLKNKLPLFLWALIAPEYILAWAIRQHLKAGEIQREWNTHLTNTYSPGHFREWTRTHGFFLIMGGFHLYSLPDGATSVAYPPELSMSNFVLPLPVRSREEEKAEHPLDFKALFPHALVYFAPTEREIKDRSKADIVAKTLVILQTSWFVAQCVARGVEHLPLTELEVVTLAYTTVNTFVYYFWWDKPKDVECPVRVYKVLKADVGVEGGEKDEWGGWFRGTIARLLEYVTGGQDNYFRLSDESQVPMFWSGKPGRSIERRSMIGASILGMVFGAIHFIALNSKFPSDTEFMLWKGSCVAMTVVPLTVTIICGVVEIDIPEWAVIFYAASLIPLPVTALLYILSRIATLVMAFTTLRALPSDAFKTVNWTTFIPHL